MELQHENNVFLRFKKVFSFFLDGIPRPFFLIVSNAEYGATFDFNLFGFLPDYMGQTENIFFPEFPRNSFFNTICSLSCGIVSPSSRIANHYSPYVGAFRFSFNGLYSQPLPAFGRHKVRVPIETCEFVGGMSSMDDRKLRTSFIIDLYNAIFGKHVEHDIEGFRRIIALGTRGISANHSKVFEEVIDELREVYVRACCYAIYHYMNRNLLFRKIMSPLCLSIKDDNEFGFCRRDAVTGYIRRERYEHFNSSILELKKSLQWGKKTHKFFKELQALWLNDFDRLVLFDTTTTCWKTNARAFIAQLGCSMRAAITRIRVEFYSKLELLLYNSFPGFNTFFLMEPKDLSNNYATRVFLAIRIFLVNRLRILIFNALQDLVRFFTAAEESIFSASKARKMYFLEVFLTVGDSGLPCAPSFALLRFGLIDLLDELLETCNNIPTPEAIIMRTFDFKRNTLNSFDGDEKNLKATLLRSLDYVGSVIADITTKYSTFLTLPLLHGLYFTRAHVSVIEAKISLLREGIKRISKVSSDIVFCGCVAINCTEVKTWCTEQWSKYMGKYMTALQNDLAAYILSSVEKCRCYNERLSKEPKTVEELEEHLCVMKKAELLSKEVKENCCSRVLEWLECLENLRISVDTSLFLAALDLMRCPSELMKLVTDAENICIRSKPFIIEKLTEFCNSTHNKVTTVKEGVVELLGLFKLDVSDIAAQTCIELRVIVDQVLKAIDYISYCETSLEIKLGNSFEDFFVALRRFEILEQFWGAIFDSTTVQNYYNSPINALSAEKMVENVQRCRRLLHFAMRGLRGYPGLVLLGRRQAHALCEFESLEGILTCLTAPGLRKNHWKEIARLIKTELKNGIQIDSNTSLKFLLDLGIDTCLEKLQKLVNPAISDFNTETFLEQMKSEAKRTRFLFTLVEGTKDAFVLSSSCRDSISLQLNSFLCDLQRLHRHASLSQYVVASFKEWEAAVDKMRSTLLSWEEIEREWVEVFYFGMTLEARDISAIPAVDSREWKFLHEKVNSVNGVFRILTTTLQKPQYTLFTAMGQENIQEQLALASTILCDIKKAVLALQDARRDAFSRFHFLSDGELASFLSVVRATPVRHLLLKMYNSICDIKLEGNIVTAFITMDGAILKAKEPIQLLPIPTESWMNTFERVLRFSFIHEVRLLTESHYHVDPMTWLRGSCVQLIDVALRIIHGRNLHDAVRAAGGLGIKAYLRRLEDLIQEYARLAGGTMESRERKVLFTAITLLIYFVREVELFIKLDVQTKSDLDKALILQTCMENDEIFVQNFCFFLPYGLEFLGNYTVPLMTSEYVEKGMCPLFLSFAASSFPIVVSEPEKGVAVEHCAQYLGRFWFCLQCYSGLTVDGIIRGLRGALSVGAVFCLKDIHTLDMSFVSQITELFQTIEIAFQSRKELHATGAKVDFGVGDTTISTRRDPCFQVVFTAENYDKIPENFLFKFRPIYLLPADLIVLAQGTLQAIGVSQYMMIGQRLAAMYEQLIEVSPNIFTLKGLFSVLYNVINADISGCFTKQFCILFLRQFWQFVKSSERLQKLIEWNLIHTLGVSQEFLEDAIKSIRPKSGFDAVVDSFSSFMGFNANVVILGPPFSGRTRLWKRWVGDMSHAVVSFRLMSCKEIYGTASQPGLLCSLARRWDPLAKKIIVMEHVNFLEASIILDTQSSVRVRSHLGLDVIKGQLVRFVVLASELNTANPRVMADFAVFVMPEQVGWKTFLKEILFAAPNYHADIAYSVISTLIECILETIPNSSQTRVAYENFFAVSSRCSQFYKRWYVYAESWSRGGEEWIGEKAFALHCAVFATCCSLGLHLHENERNRLLCMALEKAKAKLDIVAKNIDFTEDVLPPLEEDIMLYIATPVGWMKMNEEETIALTGGSDTCSTVPSFCKSTELDIQKRAWLQFFHFPSRVPTLMAVEYLLCAGQSVLLVGGKGQGKSTILQHILRNSNWLRETVYNNIGCNAVEIQEMLLGSLTMYQSKVYGPSFGRNLALCVDDVNISGDGEFSQVMHLFSFINRFSAICPPSTGYIHIKNVVCLGVSAEGVSYEPEVENSVVRVKLSDLKDSDIVEGLQKLFDATHGTRHGENIRQEVASFLAEAQAIALHLLSFEDGCSQPGNSDNNVDLVVNENKEEDNMLQKFPRRSSFGFDIANSLCLSYVYIFLKIADRVLHFFTSSCSNSDILKNILRSVYAFYTPLLDKEGLRKQFITLLRQCASQSLKSFLDSDIFLPKHFARIITQKEDEGIDLPLYTSKQVNAWILAYGVAPTHKEQQDASDSTHVVRVVSGVATSKEEKAKSQEDVTTLSSTMLRAKYPLKWLSSRILTFHRYLRQEETHIAFIGMYDEGIRRALHIWGAAMRIHVAFFRDDYARDDGNALFRADLYEIVRQTCRGDGRLVLFVPNSMLGLSWPMGCLDTLVRGGDVRRFFSNEELLFLLYGRKGMSRASGRLSSAEFLELRGRICRRLSVVVHVQSYKDMKQLATKIPFFSFTLPISLHTEDMFSELISVFLKPHEEEPSLTCQSSRQDSDVSSIARASLSCTQGLSSSSLALFLCKFVNVMKSEIDIRIDHILEFGFQMQQLNFFLQRLWRRSRQSKCITNLPNVINEAMKDNKEKHGNATVSKLKAEKKMGNLFTRSQELEELLLQAQKDVDTLFQNVHQKKTIIAQEEEIIQTETSAVVTTLSATAGVLTSIKQSQIKQFSTMSPPVKGVLLVKAVCKLLGENLPPGKGKEIWEGGKAIMTSQDFISRLMTVTPSMLKYESFSHIHTSLREVRYSDVSLFAGAVADYVVAVMEATRVGESVRERRQQLNDVCLDYSYLCVKFEKSQKRLDGISKKVQATSSALQQLEKECKDLDTLIVDLDRRQNNLAFFSDILDRFSFFNSAEEAVGEEMLAEKGEGTVIMLAAYRAFFARLPFERHSACFHTLQSILAECDIAAPAGIDDPMVSLLFPSLNDIADKTFLSACSVHERLCLGALLQRVFFNWPFFCGASPIFERVLRQVLKIMCGDCIVTSAIDSGFQQSCFEALKNGAGLLICDAKLSLVLKDLYPLFLYQANIRETQGQQGVAKVLLFGKEVKPNPSFYLVCVSSAPILFYAPGIDMASRFVNITNFCFSVELSHNVNTALLLCPQLTRHIKINASGSSSENDEHVISIFGETMRDVSSIMYDHIDVLTGDTEEKLKELGRLVGDLNTYHVRVLRLESQHKNWIKRLDESWKYLKESVFYVEQAMRVIEVDILGRHWQSRKLEPFITSASELSRSYQIKISPQTFECLSELRKEFYATVNFIERVIQVFSCGWPCELRGIFAWYILSAVEAKTGLFCRVKAELYSSSIFFFSDEQYRVFDSLLCRGSNVTNDEFVRNIYASSTDCMLKQIANDDTILTKEEVRVCGFVKGKSISGFQEAVCAFFTEWMKQNYLTCNLIASHFYNAFFFAVKEQDTDEEIEKNMLYEIAEVSPQPVHSFEGWLRFALGACIPLCLISTDIGIKLKHYERVFRDEKLDYHFFSVSTSDEMEQLMETVSVCFNKSAINQQRGHCIMVLLIPPVDAFEVAVFIQSLATLLSHYCRYGVWGSRRGGGDVSHLPALLCFAISGVEKRTVSSSSKISENSACIRVLEEWCLFLSPEGSFSRVYLLSLLKDRNFFLPWRLEGTTLVLENDLHSRQDNSKMFNGSISRQSVSLGTEVRMTNVVELQVGLCSRQVMLCRLWEREGLYGAFSNLWKPTLDSDDLTIILRLMAMWLSGERNGAPEMRRRRTGRLLTQHNFYNSMMSSIYSFAQLQERGDIDGIFTKLAYCIYAARMNSLHFLPSLTEMLQQRISMGVSERERLLSLSVVIEEVANTRNLTESFVAELSRSADDFLSLSGDEVAIAAYRKSIDDALRKLLYGTPNSARKMVFVDNNDTTTGAPDALAAVNLNLVPMSNIVQLLFLWEKDHMKSLIQALTNNGHVTKASRVRAAMVQLSSWLSGEILTVWLPALKHPRLLIHAFAAQAVSQKAGDFYHVEMVLVLLRRYNLLHDDIVLFGAALSEELENEILLYTNWDASDLGWIKGNCSNKESEEDIVIALRFQRDFKKDAARSASSLLWDVLLNDKKMLCGPGMNAGSENFAFVTENQSDAFCTKKKEIQTPYAFPVLCASIATLVDSDITCNWQLLFYAPLRVIITGTDIMRCKKGVFSRSASLPASADSPQGLSSQLNCGDEELPSFVHNSLTYFLTIS